MAEGFAGTEADWLESLIGPAGADGAPGADGASAYQVAVDEGFVGTEVEWLASLVGPEGPPGDDGADGAPGAPGVVNATAPATYNPGTQTIGVSVGTGAGTVAAGDDARITGAAPLASPAFTGNPTAPTQAVGNDTTRLATTAFVQAASGLLVPRSLVDAAGDLLVGTANDTLGRLAMGAAKQVLRVNPAATALEYAEPRSITLDSKIATTAIIGTAAESTFGTLTIPQGAPAAGDVIRGSFGGAITNDSGGAVTYIIRLKVGASTILASTAISMATNANSRIFKIEFEIVIQSATAQRTTSELQTSNVSATGTAAIVAAGCFLANMSIAEDTGGGAVAVTGTVQMSTTGGSFICREGALVLHRL